MGHVHILRDFYSVPEGISRTIRIYTPDEYDYQPDRTFPVLYFQDGQNVFQHPESALFHTWCANTTAEQLVREGAMEPWIIVGIDHGYDRFCEYSPWDEAQVGSTGRGHQFCEFVVNHLKPWVDRTYRTRPGPEWTATAGASLGGLIALYMNYLFGDSFGRVGAFSPTVMWSGGEIFRCWQRRNERWTRIYMDAGDHEYIEVQGMPLDYTGGTVALYEQLRSLGYGDHEVRLFLEPGGNHHEIDWQRRLPEAMRWLLGAPA